LGKYFSVNKASANEKQMDIGANLFVGNLAPEVDEKLLFDTFSAFGVILQVSSGRLDEIGLILQKLSHQK
jgi:RNA recognition motif-containing protein